MARLDGSADRPDGNLVQFFPNHLQMVLPDLHANRFSHPGWARWVCVLRNVLQGLLILNVQRSNFRNDRGRLLGPLVHYVSVAVHHHTVYVQVLGHATQVRGRRRLLTDVTEAITF